jgi:hypothetical protein
VLDSEEGHSEEADGLQASIAFEKQGQHAPEVRHSKMQWRSTNDFNAFNFVCLILFMLQGA